MSIARRLFALSILPAIVFVLLAVVLHFQFKEIEVRERFLSDTQVASLALVGNASRTFSELRVHIRTYLWNTSATERTAALASFFDDEAELERMLAHYGDVLITNDKDRRLHQDFRVQSREWMAEAKKCINLADASRQTDAQALLEKAVVPIAQQLSTTSTAWIKHNEELAKQAADKVVDAITDARTEMLVTCALAFGLACLMGYQTFNHLALPILALDRSVKSIASGDYAKAVPWTEAKDELGRLARSVAVLKESAAAMADHRWVTSHNTKITADIQGADSAAEFGQRLLAALVPALGGGVAAFYGLEEKPDRLRRVAGFGLAEGAQPAAEFQLGQGLVGQCAATRKPVDLDQPPPGYLRIASALGEAAPTRVTAWPLLSKDTLVAVLELAGFRPLAGRETALLDALLPVAALSFEILERNRRTAQLLDESLDQARRLEEQQGALQQSKEELLAQQNELLNWTGALQASELQFRTLIEAVPDALLIADQDGCIRIANAQAESMFGYPREELVGQPVEMLVPMRHRLGHAAKREKYHGHPSVRSMGQGMSLFALRKDGSEFPVEISLSPLPKVEGQGRWVCSSLRDVTQRRQAESELKRQSDELKRINFQADSALDLTKAGYWHVPLDGSGCYNSSERAAAIFGDLPNPEFRYRMDEWAAHVTEGDPAAAKANKENFDAAVAGTIPAYDATYAYKRPVDGRVVWVHALGRVVKDASGKSTDMYGVTQDITDFKTLELDLTQAKLVADSASLAKSAFLATMSHAIGTPMNAIINMTQLALDTELTAKQHQYLSVVASSSNGLLGLINDILDFSKVESGKMDLEIAPFGVRKLLEEITDSFRGRVFEKRIELVVHVFSDVPDQLLGDTLRLRQVLTNLVGNAFKFTEEGEVLLKVRVATAPVDGRIALCFSVKDSGIGIPKATQAKLFATFSQADSSTSRKFGGSGLGLAISKKLVELMGGTLHLNSEEGQGAEFFFTITFAVGATAAPRPTLDSLRDLHVLVADDNESAREMMHTILTQFGLSCELATDGPEALDRVRAANIHHTGRPFNLVILDWIMPGIDGLEVLRRLRGQPATSNLAVIMLSAFASRVEEERATSLGAVTFLHKPITASQLFDSIAATLLGETYPRQTVQLTKAEVAGQASIRTALAGVHVLLAEDNAANQFVAQELLESVGITLDIAVNGQEAVNRLATDTHYACVLMDMQMPVMDGLAATQEIRRRWPDRKLPIIALTANALKGEQARCIAAGMDDFVTKPIDRKELLRALRKWVAQTPRAAAPQLPAPPAAPPSTPDAPPELPGIDVQEGLQRLGLPWATLKRMLLRFAEGHPKNLQDLRDALAQQDWEAARRHAHSIAGAGGNLSAVELLLRAKALETAIMNQTGNIAPLLAAMTEELDRVLKSISTLQPAVASAAPVADGPSDAAALTRALTGLAEHLVAGDLDGILKALADCRAAGIPAALTADFERASKFADDYALAEAGEVVAALRAKLSATQA